MGNEILDIFKEHLQLVCRYYSKLRSYKIEIAKYEKFNRDYLENIIKPPYRMEAIYGELFDREILQLKSIYVNADEITKKKIRDLVKLIRPGATYVHATQANFEVKQIVLRELLNATTVSGEGTTSSSIKR